MTYEEVWQLVENSQPDDWVEHCTGEDVIVRTYKGDVFLSIVDDPDFEAEDHFNESWATCYSDPQAPKHNLRLMYDGSLVDSIEVVSVDGGRAVLPYPLFGTTSIPFRTYKAAQVGVQENGRIDEYIGRSRLHVEEWPNTRSGLLGAFTSNGVGRPTQTFSSSMTYEEVWRMVENSRPEDWIENHAADGVTEIVYKGDVRLRFIDDLSFEEMGHFNEPWATRHPNPNARRHALRLMYGSALVDTIPVVGVDGGRARLPYPNSSGGISFRAYQAARIGSQGNTLIDEYIQRSGLRVEGKEDA